MIAVCGTSTASPEEAEVAERVGRMLAERGATVVCGGLGGVMEAVARGVESEGGQSIGLLPGDDPAAANPHISIVIATGLGEIRNALIARTCLGMIAIGGGFGTLSEIGFMLRLGRPVACINSWSVRRPGDDAPEPEIHWATGANDAVGWLWERLGL
jgi:uncharacterized protein (TIGR00725 family)